MTSNESDKPAEENVLAYAAITLCANPSQGLSPQLHEIAAWQEGTLSRQRSEEILSHIANDPAFFQQWLDMIEAQSWVEDELLATADISPTEPSSLRDISGASKETTGSLMKKGIQWVRALVQQPVPVYGGALAALVLAILIVPMLQTGDGLSLQQQLDRSSDAYIDAGGSLQGTPPLPRNTRSLGAVFDELSLSDVERYYFQQGVTVFHKKLQASDSAQLSVSAPWQTWLAELPTDKIDCTIALDSSHCNTVADEFIALGQWAFITVAACQATVEQDVHTLATGFWSNQISVYKKIQALPGIAESQIFAPLLPALNTQTPDALCSIAGSVIAAGR